LQELPDHFSSYRQSRDEGMGCKSVFIPLVDLLLDSRPVFQQICLQKEGSPPTPPTHLTSLQ